MWKFWKPYKGDTLKSRPWVILCEVLDVNPDDCTLWLQIPNLDGKGFHVKWVHISKTNFIQLTNKHHDALQWLTMFRGEKQQECMVV